jgi:hypothetical protein
MRGTVDNSAYLSETRRIRDAKKIVEHMGFQIVPPLPLGRVLLEDYQCYDETKPLSHLKQKATEAHDTLEASGYTPTTTVCCADLQTVGVAYFWCFAIRAGAPH